MRLSFSYGRYLNFSIALNLILCRSLSKLVCMVKTEGLLYLYLLITLISKNSQCNMYILDIDSNKEQKSIPLYLITSSSTALESLNP